MSSKYKAATIAAISFFAGIAVASFDPASATGATIDPAFSSEPRAPVLGSAVPGPTAPPIAPPADEPKSEIVIDPQPTSVGQPASLSALVAEHDLPAELDRETECLAGAVFFEAKSESLDGQLAVAEVIKNRATSGRFPGSVCGVVFQPHQFSFVRGGALPPIPRASAQWKRAVAIAEIARDALWDSSIGEALFFHASHVSPRWKLKRVARVGNHVFYR